MSTRYKQTLKKKDNQADSSRASENIQNNNSTFITNSNGSISVKKNQISSLKPSFRQHRLEQAKQKLSNDSQQNQVIKVEIQLTPNEQTDKLFHRPSTLLSKRQKYNQSSNNILSKKVNQQFVRLDQGVIEFQRQNGALKVDNYNGQYEEYQIRPQFAQTSNIQKTFPQYSVKSKNNLIRIDKVKKQYQNHHAKDINSRDYFPDQKRNGQQSTRGLLSPLKNNFSERQLKQVEQSPSIFKNRRMATFQSNFLQQLRIDNLQRNLLQPYLKKKNKQKKVNLQQIRVQYNPLQTKNHSQPIQLHTFEEIQNSLNGKSKKYIINNYKSENHGLQRKIEDQANSFLEQMRQGYNEYYRQKALDESTYSKRDQNSYSKISSMNKINTLNQINYESLDHSNYIQSKTKKNLNSHKNRVPTMQSEISQLDDIHLQYSSLLDSSIEEEQSSNLQKKNKQTKDKLFNLINAHQQIKTEPDKKSQYLPYLKRNKLEESWPHQEQNIGDNIYQL